MFKFIKAIARVIKKDEVPESQGCGCGPRKSQNSTEVSCCGPAQSSGSELNPTQKPMAGCTSCGAPVESSGGGNSSEKLQTSTESGDDDSPTGFCCG